MTIPMYKIERTTIKMNPDHGCRYKELTSALNERQQSDRSYLAACYLLSADEDIFDIAKPYVSFDGINFAAIRMRVKKRFGTYNEYTAIEVGFAPKESVHCTALQYNHLRRCSSSSTRQNRCFCW